MGCSNSRVTSSACCAARCCRDSFPILPPQNPSCNVSSRHSIIELFLLGLFSCRVPDGGKTVPSTALRWTFGPFALDFANACLWHGTDAVALPPKVFDVLHYLVTH